MDISKFFSVFAQIFEKKIKKILTFGKMANFPLPLSNIENFSPKNCKFFIDYLANFENSGVHRGAPPYFTYLPGDPHLRAHSWWT